MTSQTAASTNGVNGLNGTQIKECSILPADYYASFISTAAKDRKPSPIRGLFPLEQRPGVISLLAGKPNGTTFPLTSLSFTVRSPTEPGKESTLTVDGAALVEGLQYSATSGIPSLVKWLTDLQQREHHRSTDQGWRISVTSGSQDAIYKAAGVLLNPGDSILVEKPVYAGVIPIFKSLGSEMIEVETDAEGIVSSSLRSILESWPALKPKPKALYTVPYGCNPTGMTATLERRLETLALAREHKFIILEDDPYYYLYFGSAPRIPSYFTLEAQTGLAGHVLRFDSFSKILSAGIRIGFATGPEPLLDAMDLHTSSANLQPASLTQSITFALLNSWGPLGFQAHTQSVSNFYKQKRDVFEAAMRRQLEGLAEWTTPEAGMFFWFKLLLSEDPNVEADTSDLIATKALEGGVLALPGTVFIPNGAKTAHVRAAFSLLEEHEVNEALRRLRLVILKERGEA